MGDKQAIVEHCMGLFLDTNSLEARIETLEAAVQFLRNDRDRAREGMRRAEIDATEQRVYTAALREILDSCMTVADNEYRRDFAYQAVVVANSFGMDVEDLLIGEVMEQEVIDLTEEMETNEVIDLTEE